MPVDTVLDAMVKGLQAKLQVPYSINKNAFWRIFSKDGILAGNAFLIIFHNFW